MKIKLTAFFTAFAVIITFFASTLIVNASLQDSPVSIEYTDGTAEQWDGKTRITITKDCTITVNNNFCIFDEPIIISENVKVTVLGGNNTVSIRENYLTKPALLFEVAEGAELTVENLEVGNANDLTITDSGGTAHTLNFIHSYGSLTLNNVNFSITNGCVVSSAGTDAKLEINGGKIEQKLCRHGIIHNGAGIADISNLRLSTEERYVYGIDNRKGGTMTLNGCNLTNCGIYNSEAVLNVRGGTIENELNNEHIITNDGGTLNVYDGKIHGIYNSNYKIQGITNIYGGNITWDDKNEWAVINAGKIYIKGGTVQTLYNSGYDDEPYGYAEISENGKIISNTNAITNYGEVYIKGGEVFSDSEKGSCVINYGTLDISGGEIKFNGYYAIFNHTGGTVDFDNASIEAKGSALCNDSDAFASISGGDISSESYYGMYNYGELTVSGGNIKSRGDFAIGNYKDGTLEISGGIIEAGSSALYNRTGGSAAITGGELASEDYCIYNAGDLDISDGEIISKNSYSCVQNTGTLSLSGGSFGTDSAQSQVVLNSGKLNLSGAPTFQNTSFRLKDSNNITIDGVLTNTEPYEVYIDSTVPRVITEGWSNHMQDKDPSDHFSSPYSLCKIVYSDGEALMRSFMVTFNANGGTCPIENASVDSYGKISPLPEAKREDHAFDGWFTAKEGGSKVTEDTEFTDDAEVYAHWSECKHAWRDTYEKNDEQHWQICTKCGEMGEKANHAWNDGEITKQPTEESGGIKEYTCTVCGKTKEENLPKLNHTHAWSDTYEKDDEQHWQICTKCSEAGEKSDHAWNDGEITKQPTEESGGIKVFTCTVCGKTKEENLPKLNHTHAWRDTYEKNDEQHWQICTKCGEKGEKADHAWNDGEITKQPTEESGGLKVYTCTVCGKTKEENLPKLNHTHVWSDTYEKDDEQHWHICTECGEAGEKADHIWNDGEITKQPTEESGGIKVFTCTVCGKIKEENLPKLDHTHVWSDTYEKDDEQHWHICTECGEAGEKADHIWNDGEITKQPTEESGGIKVFTCTVCGKTKEENLPKLDHTHVWSDTYEKDGEQHWHICTKCGEAGEKSDHIWNNGEITKQPTWDEAGEKLYTCSVCGMTETEVIPAMGGRPNVPVKPVVPNEPEDPDPPAKPDEPIIPSDPDNSDNTGTPDRPDNTEASAVPSESKTTDNPQSFDGTTFPNRSEQMPADNGSIIKEVQTGENAPEAELVTPLEELIGAVLTEEEREIVNDGTNIRIILTVEDGTELAPAEDKAAVEAVLDGLPGYRLGQYLNVNLLKIIGNVREKITETNGLITVKFEVPEALRGSGRRYAVIRVHGGETTMLEDTDSDDNTVTVLTDRFSTYALVYSENGEGGNPKTGAALPPILTAVISAAALTVCVKRSKKE